MEMELWSLEMMPLIHEYGEIGVKSFPVAEEVFLCGECS